MIDFESSVEDRPHHGLPKLVGVWKGTTRTWFEPGKLADESETTASIQTVLGGRFALCEYSGSLMSEELEGMAIIGYNLPFERYESAWIDTAHMGTGIMYSLGENKNEQVSVVGRYAEAPRQDEWGWRTEIDFVNADHIVIRAFNITPSGEEAKAVEHDLIRQ